MATLGSVVQIAFIVTAVGVGIFAFAGDLLQGYGSVLPGNLSVTEQNLINALNQTNEITQRTQTELDTSGGISVAGGFAILTKSTLAAIKLPFVLIGTSLTTFAQAFSFLGLPTWAFTLLIGLIVITISYAIFSAILRQRI